MSKSVNRVTLIGHVGAHPDTHTFEDGNITTKFPLATTESWKDKKGVKQEKTEWHNIIVKIQRLAEVTDEYVRKGDMIYLEGKIQSRTYEDSEGNTKYITEIWMDTLTMLGSPKEEEKPAKKKPARARN